MCLGALVNTRARLAGNVRKGGMGRRSRSKAGLGTFAAPAHFSVMHENAARYLDQANACLDEAKKATRAADKEAWLKLAEEWMAMAEKVQKTSHENSTVSLVSK